jgi:putative hydrolase of the HAD superfamily
MKGAFGTAPRTRAVLFDVDFTLIYPGPIFQAEGYRTFCHRYGIAVDERRFADAVSRAAVLLERPDHAYDPDIFIRYTCGIITGMGGEGDRVEPCAREIYDEWSSYHHFSLYPDVEPALRDLHAAGVRVGLVSNSQRPLEIFAEHFALDGLIAAAVSSAEHGYLKPHPSIFREALRLMEVAPEASVMIGDSLRHDIEGARRAGMRGVLLRRPDRDAPPVGASDEDLERLGIPVIASLTEIGTLLRTSGVGTA